MVTVAILGASGFIGSRLVEMLHLGGVMTPRPIVRRIASLASFSRFALDFRAADALNRSALRQAFSGCEVVVHAVAGGRDTILGSLEPTYGAARDVGVRRFVYLSTASVHGQAPTPGTDEDSPLDERQPIPYNTWKIQAERRLLALRQRGGPELVLPRPGIVYGPRSSWITGFADDLLRERAYLVDGGRGICNGVYVDNLVHAIVLAMTAPRVDGEAFLIGDRERYAWCELYQPVAEALGYDPREVAEAAPPKSAVPPADASGAVRLRAVLSAPRVRAVLSRVPERARRALGAAAYEMVRSAPPDPPSPWTFDASEPPAPSRLPVGLELELLHRCQYKLPHAKAARLLGYEPPVSFAEACRRTVGWLAFAGYPVIDRVQLPPPSERSRATSGGSP